MMCPRTLPYALVLAAACGRSSSPAPSPAPTPAPPPVVSPGAPPRAPVSAAPDQPRGRNAERVADYARLIEPVVKAFQNTAPFFTPNGKQVLFSSNRDGLPQLYVADADRPDSPPRRIATPERALRGESFDGKTILFRSDTGADENWSIFRVGIDGTGLAELTPDEKLQRDTPIAPARRSKPIFFSARKLAVPETKVFALDPTAGGAPEAVYQDPVQGSLADVSPNGKLGLYIRRARRTDNTLVLVDFATRSGRPLHPRSGQVAIFDARFSADGKRVFLSTDNGGEESFLLALDTRTGKEVARHAETSPPTAQVTGIAVSRAGNRVAIQVEAGHEVHLRLLDASSLAVERTLELPPGSGFLGDFSRDGKRLTFGWATPEQPPDIHAAAAATGTTTRLRAEDRPSLATLPPIEVTSGEVTSFDGTKVPVIVYLPAGAARKRLPVIVSYHGGPAGVSRVTWNVAARFFTSLGYAFVDPNVRGSSGYGRAYEMADNGPRRLDAFKDVEAVGRWVAAQPWADRERLVVYGGSYGGYTVLIALTRMPDIWRAGVDLFGVVNMHTFLRSTTGVIRELFKLEFGDLDQDAAFLDSISPHRDVAKIVDPLFVYAGANDSRVPKTESDQIVVALRERGVPVEYMVKDNEGHSLARRQNQIEFYSRVARFLEVHLNGTPR